MFTPADIEQFNLACTNAAMTHQKVQSIGRLGERSLHAAVKWYLEPDEQFHEVCVGSHVADIFRDGCITEIQTRQFDRLRNKLTVLLPDYPITVVFPIAQRKRIFWVDTQTGLIRGGRLSPRRGSIWDVVPELYKIKSFLPSHHLRFQLLVMEMDEYRLLNGWSHDKKKGAHRADRIPTALCSVCHMHTPQDFVQLIPAGLPRLFTSADFAKSAGISRKTAQTTLNILFFLGIVMREGKQGNAHVYSC